jgi:hypothetical protein
LNKIKRKSSQKCTLNSIENLKNSSKIVVNKLEYLKRTNDWLVGLSDTHNYYKT